MIDKFMELPDLAKFIVGALLAAAVLFVVGPLIELLVEVLLGVAVLAVVGIGGYLALKKFGVLK